MRFSELPIPGAFLVELTRSADARGSFARTWDSAEFARHGLSPLLVQASVSHNLRRGTVRGMHMQLPPSREAKLVRCTRGSILDVILDMRPDSPRFLQHHAVELHATQGNALYLPATVAHGFQTLVDDTEVFYQMTDVFAPHLATGWRWDDPAFGIRWPQTTDIVLGERDATYPDFSIDAYRALLATHSPSPAKSANAS